MPEARRTAPAAHGPGHRRATALRYAAGQGAPTVAATGRGPVADAIVRRAREAGVAVRQDPALAQALDALQLGEEIPEPLYAAVAEALAWVYALERRGPTPAPAPTGARS